ncbi:carboxymuconolactone decarboxylase family protein [bacterium]|nr:carboxymuconolactone decarboxylase family protein [bacterium]
MAIIPSLSKEQVEEPAKEIYEEFERQGKKVPEWVKVMAHRPEILKEFFELFNAIMGKGTVKPIFKWKIAYTVSETLKCPFCVDVTTKMLKKLGATDQEVQEAEKLQNLSEKEKEALELVKEVTLKAHVCSPELFDEMKKNFSDPEIVEIVSIIGLFNYINRFNNTFCILPE